MNKKKILCITGPTASGKTALSLALAARLNGQIVCMDSMQIYRGMDIGTAKPTIEERHAVPHYMLDIVSPCDSFSVTDYARQAAELLERLPFPILVGGTGLYLKALTTSMEFGTVPADEKIREKYHRVADEQGPAALHRILEACDPESARRLHENDIRRVVRALEIYEITGKPMNSLPKAESAETPFDIRSFAILQPREVMYDRVNRRVDQMIEDGLEDEVRTLLETVPKDAQSMQGLGYKELIPVLRGQEKPEDAVSLIKLRTRHYAKRQMTWFGADKSITWLPCDMPVPEMCDTVISDFNQKQP